MKQVLSNSKIQGIGQLRFDGQNQADEQILTLANDNEVRLQHLNPLELSIFKKSLACFKVLVNEFGMRQSYSEVQLEVRIPDYDSEELLFSNIILPLILKTKDNEILSFVLKNEGFFMQQSDLKSFVRASIKLKWA